MVYFQDSLEKFQIPKKKRKNRGIARYNPFTAKEVDYYNF